MAVITAKHLPDSFYPEGGPRISLRNALFRAVASNIQIRTKNSNKSHGFGPINPDTFLPFPKKPVIARFFRKIGRADEPGSGVRNLLKYGQVYGGQEPEFVEGDIFRIIVKYPDVAHESDKAPEVRLPKALIGEVSRQELQSALELKDYEHFLDISRHRLIGRAPPLKQ
ncbi:MAG: hypothetical protein RQ715_00345 [Methylococcales bacterium]|nr:hypothetical protein [Methylococcales bacterium]